MFQLPLPPPRPHQQHTSRLQQQHQQRQRTHQDPESQLPRGDCRFILLHPETTGQRCSCQGFWLNKSVPGSSCVCGHQACYHVPDLPSAESVSRNDYLDLAEKLRKLEQELEREKSEREEEVKGVYRAIRGVYHNHGLLQTLMSGRLVDFEDKVESVMDKAQGFTDGLKFVMDGLVRVDDASMDLETRVEEIRSGLEDAPKAKRRRCNTGHRAVKSEDLEGIRTRDFALPGMAPTAWTANVTFVPSASQLTPFGAGTSAYLRCRSRGLNRRITFPGWCHRSFAYAIETTYATVLADRRWMPLVSNICAFGDGNSQVTLQRLSDNQRCSDLWDAAFVKSHCAMLTEKQDVETIYIALRNEDLSWEDIKKLSTFEDMSPTCWEHHEDLDGRLMDDEGLDVGEIDNTSPTPVQPPKDLPSIVGKSPLEVLASLAPMPTKRPLSSLDMPMQYTQDDELTTRARVRQKLPGRHNSH
ncbi:MAG: hypothetical protein M1827_004799 [Pycnora praestabilis]|nr:MAG: hypothetical protein M1827_004799 [Pycnora praestabilis]